MDWYILSLIAFFCYGIQNFFYKVSAEKKCNTAYTTFSFMLTVAILSSILFFISKESVSNLSLLLFIAFLNAVTFLTTTIARIESLKHIPANLAYPLIRLSTVIVVLFSIFYFKDNISTYQILGIILAIVVILILTKEGQERKIDKNFRLGILLAALALIASSATTIIQKFAAVMVNKLGYIVISYIYNIFFSLGLRKKLKTEKENPQLNDALVIGFLIGVFNFLGFYTILKALSIGPLSLVASINSLSFVVPIILSTLVYKEKVTKRGTIGIILLIIAIVLLRI